MLTVPREGACLAVWMSFVGCREPPLERVMRDAGTEAVGALGNEGPRELAVPRSSVPSLIVGSSDGVTVTCAGVFVDPSWMLTAAHCIQLSGQVGASIARPGTDGREPEVLPVEQAVTHPALDVALLRVAPAGDSVTPLTLARRAVSVPSGARAYSLTLPHRGDGSVSPRRVAEEALVSLDATSLTVRTRSGEGPCVGDSGTPLLLASEAGQLTVAGVLSRGSLSCQGPDEYVRADVLVDWVERTVTAAPAGDPRWTPGAASARCGAGPVRRCEALGGPFDRCRLVGALECEVGQLASAGCASGAEQNLPLRGEAARGSVSDAVLYCARALAEIL